MLAPSSEIARERLELPDGDRDGALRQENRGDKLVGIEVVEMALNVAYPVLSWCFLDDVGYPLYSRRSHRVVVPRFVRPGGNVCNRLCR